MKKAYLHIGVEKTGTTTIQSFMAENRAALQSEGFLYPVAPGKSNHVGITILALDNPNQLSGLLPYVRLEPGADVSIYKEQMLLELRNEVAESGCHTLVFSNEHLSSRVRTPKAIKTARDTLLRLADVVEVIVYLRRQDEAVLSDYSTRVKAGYTEPFVLERPHFVKYNYADLLDRWAAEFGPEHISVKLFEKGAFEGGDLITDFLQTIHFPAAAVLSPVAPQNVSLDVVCLEYLRRLNKYLPPQIDGRRNRERGNIAFELTSISTGEKPRISTEEADEILKQFEKSNRDVAVRYLNRPDGQLFATQPERSVTNNLLMQDEDMVFKISAALWRRMRGSR